MEAVKEIVLILLTSLISGGSAFIFARQKYGQEVQGLKVDNESKEIANLKASIELYNLMIEDLRREVQHLREKVLHLEKLRK
jgi:hypothetical protein